MRDRCVTAIAGLLFFSVSAWSAGMIHVRGELTCDSCNYYTAYSVELQEMYGNSPVERAMVRNNGEFSAYVPSGNYMVTVIVAGSPIKVENVTIRDGIGTMSIRVPNVEPKQKPGAGVISFARIKHKVPKQAEKEFKAAYKKYEAGDVDASLEHLKRATEIDSEYVEAWNNLGCRYLAKRQPAEALTALQRAAAIDKNAPFVHTNLGIAACSRKHGRC
jgi:tetratricopeptide (TPR) repeat protein